MKTSAEVLSHLHRFQGGFLPLTAVDAREAHYGLINSATWKAWCHAGNRLTEEMVKLDPAGWASENRFFLSWVAASNACGCVKRGQAQECLGIV